MQNRSFAAAVKAAFPHTIPIMTGYLAVGMAYGVLMASKGYGFLWAGFVSAFAFCGSMQYVAITLLTTAFDPLQAFVLSLMVNARHLFFALALLPKYRGLGRLRYFMIYTLSDENFSLLLLGGAAGGHGPHAILLCHELPDLAVLGGVLHAGWPAGRADHL